MQAGGDIAPGQAHDIAASVTSIDTRQTREERRKLLGWLSYAFASEVFAVCSLTLFLPICLEQFARDNGSLAPDYTRPCSSLPPPGDAVLEPTRCMVHLGWAWVDTASFSLYVISASVALQAVSVISLGGIADHYRKELLLIFAAIGSISAALFLFLSSTSPLWPICALFAALANTSFGVSVVALNSYLPGLARGSPKAAEANAILKNTLQQNVDPSQCEEESDPFADPRLEEDAPLVGTHLQTRSQKSAADRYNTIVSQETARISSRGIALGYAAGIVLLLLILIPVTKLHGSTFSLRLAIGASGIWWAIFTIPAALWLPSTVKRQTATPFRSGHEVLEAWKRLGKMLRPTEMKRLKNTFFYLAAWFLLSDGFTTITGTAVLFAKTVLNMPPTSLILIGVLTPACGILGSLLWPRLQVRLGWTNIRALVALVALAALIPAYGCLGFIPYFAKGKSKFGGLTTPGEMFALAVYFGSLYGAFQSYARSVFAELIPPGEEARFFGLFSITDKSSSFLGPLIVGLIADVSGNIRYAFFFLVFMILLPIPLLLFVVDVDRGREDAQAYGAVQEAS